MKSKVTNFPGLFQGKCSNSKVFQCLNFYFQIPGFSRIFKDCTNPVINSDWCRLVSQSGSQSTNYTYIDRGHMLRDNALKFLKCPFWRPFRKLVKFVSIKSRDNMRREIFCRYHTYVIPQKPVEIENYMIKNVFLVAILHIREILVKSIDHMLQDNTLKFNRDHA